MKNTRHVAEWVVIVAGLLGGGPALADVSLPAIISNHMVLQAGVEAPIWGWADPGEDVSVSIGNQTKTTRADAAGQWKVKLDKLPPGPAGTLTIKGKNTLAIQDVLAGEVWLCAGQSNMVWSIGGSRNAAQEIANARSDGMLRMFLEQSSAAVEPQAKGKGSWLICNPATNAGISAVVYFFGREIHQKIEQPVGLIVSAVGGTPIEAWTSMEVQQNRPELKPLLESWATQQAKYNPDAEKVLYEKRRAAYPEAVAKAKAKGQRMPFEPRLTPPPRTTAAYPGNLFNGKIVPLIPYGIRGAIWYQGESNTQTIERGKLFARQLPWMIEDWRARWGQGDFPFAWVQLPNFNAKGYQGWREVRESMLKSLSIPNTGMAIAIELGEADNIHPANKQDVAHRLALWALAKVYGKNIPFSGPLPQGQEFRDGQVICSFQHTDGGLKTRDGGEVKGFMIAGADRKWAKASAKIVGNQVVVSAADLKQPIAVRYAWESNPDCNLVNGANLPASPFRTDDW